MQRPVTATANYTPLRSRSSTPSSGGGNSLVQEYPPSSPEQLVRKLHVLHPEQASARDNRHAQEGHEEGERASQEDAEEDGGDDDEAGFVAEGEDRITRFVLTLACTAAISGLLFGYDTGVISGTLVVIGRDLGSPLSDWQKELITSATTLGALIGGLVAGGMSDHTGRKRVITLASVVFVLGALVQAACHTVSTMIAGRFIVGVGVGLASCIVPLYIGELAPDLIRGKLVTINVVAVTLGQVLAYAIGATFQHVSHGWRYMVGIGAVPAVIQLFSLAVLPESPRMLLVDSRVDEARAILSRVYPAANPSQLEGKIRSITDSVRVGMAAQAGYGLRDRLGRLMRVGANRRALVIGSGLQAAQQLCGFNTLMYYSASIFAALGFNNPTAVGLIIAFVNFLFTLVALRIVDPFGRRRTMLYTLPVLVGALLACAVCFRELTRNSGGVLVEGQTYSTKWTSLVLLSMIIYVAGYATGLGNIPWQQGELFRIEVRGVGTSICTAVNWSCNLLIAATFLSLMNAATPSGAFGIYAVFCAAAWVFCLLCYPETSGLSLEEVFEVFVDDFGVQKSIQMRREKMGLPHTSRYA